MIRKTINLVQERLVTAVFMLGVWFMLSANIASAKLEDDIRARISPPGTPCVMGEECAAGLALTGAGAGGPKDPQEVYETFCFACHGTGANESPILGDAEAWQPRIAKGIDALYESALNGFNNNLMPARGLCMDCSDDDIKATVDYLVEAAQQ